MIFLCIAILFGVFAAFCFVMAARELEGAVDAVEEGGHEWLSRL